MMRRRRRPLVRAAMVGGVAYHAGKKTQQGREQEYDQEARLEALESQSAAAAAPAAAPAPAGGLSDDAMAQLKQLAELKESGVLTQQEFDDQKRRILQG
jgi:hypothetical protein